ncbi:MAG: hypothetical protein ACYTG7_22145 [Planctomycetota bacterium]
MKSNKSAHPPAFLLIAVAAVLYCASCGEESNLSPLEQNEQAVKAAMKDFLEAQNSYKSRKGTFARNLSELEIPAEMAAAEYGASSGKSFHGYQFAMVPRNGQGAMNYRKEFVLCAVPTNHGSTGRLTFGMGPKGIVIMKDNRGKPVRNATEFADGTWKRR